MWSIVLAYRAVFGRLINEWRSFESAMARFITGLPHYEVVAEVITIVDFVIKLFIRVDDRIRRSVAKRNQAKLYPMPATIAAGGFLLFWSLMLETLQKVEGAGSEPQGNSGGQRA